ncbi:MAG: HAD family acid phosphatase [Woeseiaceae bacterium]
MAIRFFMVSFTAMLSAACSTQATVTHSPQNDLALLWVNHAAEYGAITTQTYQSAAADLPRFLADTAWTAQPGQYDVEGLPPAVILDVDETTISNARFQMAFERPMAQWKLEKWNDEHQSDPVPGVAQFVKAAQDAGVTVFFVTNRPCANRDNGPDPCPQKAETVRDIGELGIETDVEHVLLANENGWDRAKIARREHIAQTHRIIMLFGDDLGDFMPCVRTKLYGPCTEPATKQSRAQIVADHRHLWGNGWYIVPGPMHGSWTSFTD